VSHDLSVVSRHADRVICLNRKIVCQGATTETLTPENLAAMYGSGAHLFSHSEGPGHLHEPPASSRDGEKGD
jgi:zinc/manganese transport system ATP-binding protein